MRTLSPESKILFVSQNSLLLWSREPLPREQRVTFLRLMRDVSY